MSILVSQQWPGFQLVEVRLITLNQYTPTHYTLPLVTQVELSEHIGVVKRFFDTNLT